MPTPLLFDLDSIDTTAVLADREAVGRVNPQTGHMRFLDHVIWVDPTKTMILGLHFVRHDEFWVPGHIPGRPLFPGVLMIEAGAQVSSWLHRTKWPELGFIGFTRCDETVFRGQVVPGDTMYLLAREVSSNARRFISKTQGVVNGKIVFESQITGMTI